MGIKERQERERQAVRDAILSAARDLFVTEGYRNVSMRKIAERIEYSPAAIYSYFPNKDAIFFALAEEGFRLLAAAAGAAPAELSDPAERVRHAVWAFYEFSKQQPQYFELMFVDRSVPSLNQDWHRFEFFHEVLARVETDIRACSERGIFSAGLDASAAMHVLWAGMLGVATINFANRLGPGEDPDALAHDTLATLMAGFTTTLHTTFVATECFLTHEIEATEHAS
ncbi:MAG: TetR/AcrR family transcriptional regulator [Vicinamibacterales bacterium]